MEWRRYTRQGARSHLYWSIGLMLVFFTLIEEAIFYSGYWTSALLSSYFFLVALLVGILSFGSAENGLPAKWRGVYMGYTFAAMAVVAFFCAINPVSGSVLSQGVVTGNPSLGIILSSTALTVPAATLMAGLALLGVYPEPRVPPRLHRGGDSRHQCRGGPLHCLDPDHAVLRRVRRRVPSVRGLRRRAPLRTPATGAGGHRRQLI